MKTAELIIYGDIGFEVTARGVSDELKRAGKVDELHVRVNSFGGDAFDGVAIYQRLAEHSARVVVHVDGIAASAASVIAMAGDEILIARAGFMMIHDAWVGAVGNAMELRQAADRAEALSAQMAGIYERRSKQDMATIRAWMAEERTFASDEAIAAGLATRSVEAERMAAKYDPERHHFRRPPPIETTASDKMAAAARTVARMKMHLRKSQPQRRA
jgi:ATP-dependent Clp protease protease subunit